MSDSEAFPVTGAKYLAQVKEDERKRRREDPGEGYDEDRWIGSGELMMDRMGDE